MNEVVTLFLDQKLSLVFEKVSPDGSHPDCFEGRLINPGRGIEAMWFIMEIARRRNDQDLINKAVDVVLNTLDFAWDKEYGGIGITTCASLGYLFSLLIPSSKSYTAISNLSSIIMMP